MIQHHNVQYKENAAYNYWHEKMSDLNINEEQAYNSTGNRSRNWTCDTNNLHISFTNIRGSFDLVAYEGHVPLLTWTFCFSLSVLIL